MTIETLQAACNSKPFRPFTIRLADGRGINVASREYIMAAPSGQTVVVCQPDDALDIIDLHLITNLEMKPHKRRK